MVTLALLLVAFLCFLASNWGLRRALYRGTLADTWRATRLLYVAPWRTGLVVLGVGFTCLAFWRLLSGL